MQGFSSYSVCFTELYCVDRQYFVLEFILEINHRGHRLNTQVIKTITVVLIQNGLLSCSGRRIC